MIFDGTISFVSLENVICLYVLLFSTVNQVMLIPTVIFECYFGNIYTLWAGFIFVI